jgi:hypothetical protein
MHLLFDSRTQDLLPALGCFYKETGGQMLRQFLNFLSLVEAGGTRLQGWLNLEFEFSLYDSHGLQKKI